MPGVSVALAVGGSLTELLALICNVELFMGDMGSICVLWWLECDLVTFRRSLVDTWGGGDNYM